jgi:hypothetical protein
MVAEKELENPATPGHGKKTGQVHENMDYWRIFLPKYYPKADTNRFMRLIRALEIQKPVPL